MQGPKLESANTRAPGLVGLLASVFGTGLAQGKYMDTVQDSFDGDGIKDWGLRKWIQLKALTKGYTPKSVPSSRQAHITKFKEPQSFGPFKIKGNLVSSKNTSPGIMAHEYGHILQDPNIGLYSASRSAPLLAAVGGAALRSNKAKLVAALTGTAAGLPTIGYEIDASRRGRNLLKDLGYKNPSEAYAGVPTYLANGSMPLTAYGVEKLIRKVMSKGKA